ncbi:wd40 repeat-containing protein : Uncharacterized protein OS=Galerina marginata CBS 339.88 GN=GALMADRAFT_139557 PE=4 SV=1: WD40 [Gemmata massiliana]|uniref:Uncharacterized protein n=1 Tax=Gemmata massiliana TaxID=1210884 RepID=A0A6P2D733_9BACT|nr:WD40 repeat domain-containing protein [Gemmata massiliana]VTR96276.1 wd40 repeat-containing protein : Uncharacterized protein OS=Galerina marginata CBS 339.88 GN=GALMADRAFT_139557 PE=4 SV=1: WD40 [Gemmata massiliana]
MLRFELPTDRIEYLQLALPSSGPALVVRWGTQTSPFTVAAWDDIGSDPSWKLTERNQNLSPDGQWVSVFDQDAGKVRVTRVGDKSPTAVVNRSKKAENVWTGVAPGGTAVAWKDDTTTLVRALPGGKEIARVKSGWGVDFRFSPGGRWLSETGLQVFRVFDRSNNYKVFARIKTPDHALADVSDAMTAVVTAKGKGVVEVWDLSSKTPAAVLKVGGWVSALAVSPDGRRVLTGTTNGDVTLWDATGAKLKEFAWEVKMPIAAVFAPDGTRAAIGGVDTQIVVWDLDD